MGSPIEIIVQNMIRQGGGNLQMVAQNIMKRNPQFAQRIQGQNVQELAMNEMRKRGMNPQIFMNGMFGK